MHVKYNHFHLLCPQPLLRTWSSHSEAWSHKGPLHQLQRVGWFESVFFQWTRSPPGCEPLPRGTHRPWSSFWSSFSAFCSIPWEQTFHMVPGFTPISLLSWFADSCSPCLDLDGLSIPYQFLLPRVPLDFLAFPPSQCQGFYPMLEFPGNRYNTSCSMAWRALEVNINSAQAQVCYVSGNCSLNSE